MKIVIIGNGKLGDSLVSFISGEGHDVTVIDKNSKRINSIANQYDAVGIVGNGASCETLLAAGADKCDLLIASTESDEVNLMCCIMGKTVGARHAIARVRNPEYSKQAAFMCGELKISMIVNPDLEASYEMERMLQFPVAMKVDSFARGKVALCHMKVTLGHPMTGIRLADMSKKFKSSVLVCTVERNDEVIIPNGDFVVKEGDIVYVSASYDQLSAFFKECGVVKKRLRSVMIIGGGKISFYLASRLLKSGFEVKIIEINQERCEVLSEMLPKATIINADGTDSAVLIDEGIDEVDACITLTDIDEENILVSMLAQSRDISKIITKVTRSSFMKLLENLDIQQSIVSPKFVAANRVLKYLRGIRNSKGSCVETLYKIVDNRAEAIEFIARDNIDFYGIPLKELSLKKNLLVAAIIRGNTIIYPDGESFIKQGDRVIIVTTIEGLRDLKDIEA